MSLPIEAFDRAKAGYLSEPDLRRLGRACQKLGLTRREFVWKATRDALDEFEREEREGGI